MKKKIVIWMDQKKARVYKSGKKEITEKIECWIKSRDRGFYQIEYSWRKGGVRRLTLNKNL